MTNTYSEAKFGVRFLNNDLRRKNKKKLISFEVMSWYMKSITLHNKSSINSEKLFATVAKRAIAFLQS